MPQELSKYLIDNLSRLGLSKSEAKLYLLLLKYPNSTVEDLRKKLNISATRIYTILNHLELKGLVEITYQKPRRYMPVSPYVATNILVRNREKQFYESLSIREKLLNHLIEKKIYRDKNAIMTNISEEIKERESVVEKIREIINKSKELLIMGTTNELTRIVYRFELDIVNAKDRGTEMYFLAPFTKAVSEISNKFGNWGKIKDLEPVYIRMYIRDEKEAFFLPTEPALFEKKEYDVGVLIHCTDIVRQIRNFFFCCWENAKEVKLN